MIAPPLVLIYSLHLNHRKIIGKNSLDLTPISLSLSLSHIIFFAFFLETFQYDKHGPSYIRSSIYVSARIRRFKKTCIRGNQKRRWSFTSHWRSHVFPAAQNNTYQEGFVSGTKPSCLKLCGISSQNRRIVLFFFSSLLNSRINRYLTLPFCYIGAASLIRRIAKDISSSVRVVN